MGNISPALYVHVMFKGNISPALYVHVMFKGNISPAVYVNVMFKGNISPLSSGLKISQARNQRVAGDGDTFLQ
jgi:hypothetical protein